jgi:CRP-like cAMP-binding protein
MQSVDLLSQQIQTSYKRIVDLSQPVLLGTGAGDDILPVALKELGIASEELQIALEELTEQAERLAIGQHQASIERLHYRDLFEFAPDALIITTLNGIIQDINRAGAALLARQAEFLIGKPLATLAAVDHRTRLRDALYQVTKSHSSSRFGSIEPLIFEGGFHRIHQPPLQVSIRLDVIQNDQGVPVLLRWHLKEMQQSKWTVPVLPELDCFNYEIEQYCKGEAILLAPQMLYLVVKGTVKLTTLSNCGEDILVGLAREESVFGSSLTSLSVYQAIALSAVELVAVSVLEMNQSPALLQVLMPRLVQRLQQSEQFSMIRGHLRMQEHVHQFLQILKAEFGEALDEEKTRIKVKLTHQDFASACCTTRVTITRLLGQLQQLNVLSFDSQGYLILHHEALSISR